MTFGLAWFDDGYGMPYMEEIRSVVVAGVMVHNHTLAYILLVRNNLHLVNISYFQDLEAFNKQSFNFNFEPFALRGLGEDDDIIQIDDYIQIQLQFAEKPVLCIATDNLEYTRQRCFESGQY